MGYNGDPSTGPVQCLKEGGELSAFAVVRYLNHHVNNGKKLLTNQKNPSQDSSIGSILAWYRGGPRFKSWQGREFFSENK